MKFESLDLRILEELRNDARQSFRRVASKLGVSVGTVTARVDRMQAEGVILGSTIRIDYEKLGFAFPVLIEIKVAHGKLFDVERKIARDPAVSLVLDHTGGTDATVFARFQDRASLDRFVKKIQTLGFVERTETKLVLNVIKEEPTALAGRGPERKE